MAAYNLLRIQNFRSYAKYSVELDPGVNIIAGPNGSGKTNLLEALYVLSVGTSFRAADRELVRHGEQWFRLEGYWGDQQRVLAYQQRQTLVDKQFSLDGTKKARLMHAQRVPVVLFEPDHLRLLRDSPATRRDYLDVILSKLQPDFSWIKHQFERVLAQRNNLLKRRLPAKQLDDYLFAWDVKFTELAGSLVARRTTLLKDIVGRLGDVYSKIASKPSAVTIEYAPTASLVHYQASLLKMLQQHRQRDVERGYTTVGPHRDDFKLNLNQAPAETTASRGEIRSLLLSLKIIELELLAERSETTPLLLLDDVFSELDTTRRQALADLTKIYQTVITTTDADNIVGDLFGDHKLIKTRP